MDVELDEEDNPTKKRSLEVIYARAQCVTLTKKNDAENVEEIQMEEVPNANMFWDEEIQVDNNVSVRNEEMNIRHKKFHDRIDWLGEFQRCHVCHESYVGIQVFRTNTGPMCMHCRREGTNHKFSTRNHMDLGTQPDVLRVLTEVEEMFIAHAIPILQVMHSIGGQYKYRGHTISFT